MSGFICAILISTNLAGAYFPSNDPVLGEGGFRGKDLGAGEGNSVTSLQPPNGDCGAGAAVGKWLRVLIRWSVLKRTFLGESPEYSCHRPSYLLLFYSYSFFGGVGGGYLLKILGWHLWRSCRGDKKQNRTPSPPHGPPMR